jgi:lipoprotein-releasing system permease protein
MSNSRQRYEWLLGTRYLRSTREQGFLSLISMVSMAGLAVGVAVLIVVLSVMNGFERELRTRMLSVTSHATLLGLEGTLRDWHQAQQVAQSMPEIVAAVPFVEQQAMLSRDERIAGSQIRGVLPAEEQRAVGLARTISNNGLAQLQPGSFAIALGDVMATQLGAKVGDELILMAAEGSATPAGILPRMRRVHIVGLFHSGMYEYDSALALMHIDDMRRIYRLGDGITGLRLALEDPLRAPIVVRQLALKLGGGFFVSDWTRNHAGFFQSIRLTKSLLFLVLLSLVAVAAFNIVSALVLVVKEKRADIAILRTLGAGPANVLAIFAIQGSLIGLIGTVAGALLGWLIAHNLAALVRWVETIAHTQFLDAKVYYMSDLPALVIWSDVFKVTSVAFLLCAVAAIYPAWRAALTEPSAGLRHE